MLRPQSNKAWQTKLLLPICIIGLLSCTYKDGEFKDVLDPSGNLTREDYEKILPDRSNSKHAKSGKEKKDSSAEPSIPEATDILTSPRPPEVGPDKLVSITITEDVPLKDVLIELGRLADVDMEIDPGITGGIILQATNKPFSEIIKSVVDLGNLRYENKDGSIKIERDLPYQVNYVTDFLNIIRSSSGNINVSTNVIGSGGSSSGSTTASTSSATSSTTSSSSSGSISSGSANQINTTYEGDLWKSVEATIKNMISESATAGVSTTVTSPSSSSSVITSTTGLKTDVNVNKQAGVISIVATQKQHNAIESYLSIVKKNISSQVLIEAKIVEVTLDKSFKAGIDWGNLADKGAGIKIVGKFNPVSATDIASGGVLGVSPVRTSLNYLVNMVEKFGTSHTISSPRLHAMNNQQAVMTVAENKVYFTVSVQDSTATATTGTTAATTNSITSTLHTVPIGIIMTLQPSINLDTDEVTMNIRPTLTTTNSANDIQDPAVALASQKNISATPEGGTTPDAVTSSIPVINVRELDSVMKIKSGEVMIMGGLMKNDTSNTDTGVPGVSRIPFFGNAFKSVVKTDKTIETVIFIKATIIPSDGVVAKADKDLYKTFIRDPRPLAF